MAFDPKRHTIKVQGREYLPVSARLVWFRTDHPDWGIVTEAVEINLEKQYAIFRATIFNEDGRLIATATKREDVKGFGDYMEKAETGSVGRALAFCGYGSQYAPELEEGNRFDAGRGRGAAPPPRPLPPPPAGAPQMRPLDRPPLDRPPLDGPVEPTPNRPENRPPMDRPAARPAPQSAPRNGGYDDREFNDRPAPGDDYEDAPPAPRPAPQTASRPQPATATERPATERAALSERPMPERPMPERPMPERPMPERPMPERPMNAPRPAPERPMAAERPQPGNGSSRPPAMESLESLGDDLPPLRTAASLPRPANRPAPVSELPAPPPARPAPAGAPIQRVREPEREYADPGGDSDDLDDPFDNDSPAAARPAPARPLAANAPRPAAPRRPAPRPDSPESLL